MKMKCLYEGSTWRLLSQYSFSKLEAWNEQSGTDIIFLLEKKLPTAYLFTTGVFPKSLLFDISRFLATTSEHLISVNVFSHLRE